MSNSIDVPTEGIINPDTTGTTRQEMSAPDTIVFNQADNKNFRLYKEGSITIGTTDTDVTVNHNLGYVPEHEAFVTSSALPSGYNTVPYFVNDGIVNPRVISNITATTISFRKSFTSASAVIYYKIYREKAV